MPRTISITKESLVEAAVSLLKREGMDALTARKLAKEAGCSTQPIFRAYQNMDELNADVFGVCAKIFSDHCSSYPSDSKVPFVNLGLAYISFAQTNKQVFITTHSKETLYCLNEMLEERPEYQQEMRLYTIAKTLKKGHQAYKYTYEGLSGACENGIELRGIVQ